MTKVLCKNNRCKMNKDGNCIVSIIQLREDGVCMSQVKWDRADEEMINIWSDEIDDV